VEEGFVLRWEDGYRLKLKTAEYLRLHKVLTGVSARTIWQALKNGDNLEAWKENVPDEFADFITQTQTSLQAEFDMKAAAAQRLFNRIMEGFTGFAFPTRAEFAREATKYECRDILFLMFDERPWSDRIWQRIYPPAESPVFKKEAD